jgi:hypothetical protein
MTTKQIQTHLRAVANSTSGKVMMEWLAHGCCMRDFTVDTTADTVITIAQRDALRDLYIRLDKFIREEIADESGN